ncbi:MAG: acetyltransferase, partial [Mycobacterium sp.]|nr:acetyltransferase [Mycobacterium sp.]
MAARITPLRLEAFEQLPKHARRCVYWEVDPTTLRDDHLSDPEFEKEAWLSMVMLEWGSCGQLAVECRDGAEVGDPA